MVMGREWLKGMCWIGTQIIRKSLRSRLRCAEEAQEWIVVAAEACECLGRSLWWESEVASMFVHESSGEHVKRGASSHTTNGSGVEC